MRGRLLLIIGILLALGSGCLVFFLMSRQGQQPAQVQTRKVIVAVQDLPAGTPIVPDAVTIMDKPINEVPADAISSPEKIRGKVAAVDIYRGDIITTDMLTTKEKILQEKPISLIPPGKVAFTIKVDELSSVAYSIQPGDYVDVLVGIDFVDVQRETQCQTPCPEGFTGEQIPRHVTQLTIQNAQVLNVGLRTVTPPTTEGGTTSAEAQAQPTPQPVSYSYVTLLLSQQDALVLKYLREIGAIVDLALRNPDDKSVVSTEAVTIEYILRRFNIPIPPKLDQTYKYRTGEQVR
jgi:Flp pilus assembly protein CpaB